MVTAIWSHLDIAEIINNNKPMHTNWMTHILNQRLLKYVIENNILSKEQLGFVAGNRTSDAHII